MEQSVATRTSLKMEAVTSFEKLAKYQYMKQHVICYYVLKELVFTTHGTNAALPPLPYLSTYPWPSGAIFTLTPSRDIEVSKICSWPCSCGLYFWWGTVGCLSLMWCWGTAWHKFSCYARSRYILLLYFHGAWCELRRLWVCCYEPFVLTVNISIIFLITIKLFLDIIIILSALVWSTLHSLGFHSFGSKVHDLNKVTCGRGAIWTSNLRNMHLQANYRKIRTIIILIKCRVCNLSQTLNFPHIFYKMTDPY